ncbi:hypothetical protein EXIGLDRAFT_653127 [Exidia glandulosa HHB12029]|uniref:Uncharacterized protein n=1 Tax=Exidia glandulosa HHB12029 TaxID=1314781 RepID=A0A165EBV5_EXIGL|nr:hypothetical protein EXIGLDRAFT_653127 [Exidia glandulosa HHB12029]
MAVSRPTRMLTLAHGEMETLRILPNTFGEVDALAREWVQPAPGVPFALRIPVEYLPWQAARMVQTPYVWLTSEETYQIATQGTNLMRIEIVSDAPPPPDVPALPPPPPVLEMPATFKLELNPGQVVAIDTTITSDDLDMSKTEDGTVVDGSFWGKIDITHAGDVHKMEFSGTRLADGLGEGFFFDSRTMAKLTQAVKPPVARFNLSVLAPQQQYVDITLALAPMWKLGVTWPPAEAIADNKVKFFLRVHPNGALEHFESNIVITSIYYEALPDMALLDPASYIAPYNSFAMSSAEFVPHILKVMEELGVSLRDRTNFITSNLCHWNAHRNIAYRFMSPNRLRAAIDVAVTTESCAFMRLFLMYRGVADEEMPAFAGAGEKEAMAHNWKDIVEWSERMKDSKEFRVLETAILEIA